ncbi:MAG: transposase [Acidobacteriia bacterium]|nr:transposase [Terriglobia bacterium]
MADLDQQFLLSQIARRGPCNDCANLPAVVEAASEQTRIGLVLADAEFDSGRNRTYIRQHLGARRVIPAKRGKKTWRVRGVRAEMRRAFPRKLYRRRALIETLFSSVKRKLSARAPGRSLRMQMRQALRLGLSFNLYRLRHRYPFLRMSTEPDNF